MRKNERGFAHLLVFVAVIVGIGLFSYLILQQNQPKEPLQNSVRPANTPQPALTILNYSNNELGVSFDYPSDFNVREEYGPSISVVWSGDEDAKPPRNLPTRSLFIARREKSDDLSNKYLQPLQKLSVGEMYRRNVGDDWFYEETTRMPDIEIGGYVAKVFVTPQTWEGPAPLKTIIVGKGSDLFVIYMTDTNFEDHNVDYIGTFYQILSTFEFVE